MQYFIAFLEGIITFISPCLLPMLPVYVSYFAGGGERSAGKTLKNALGFTAGFTLVFALMGALAGTLGRDFWRSIGSPSKSSRDWSLYCSACIFSASFSSAVFRGVSRPAARRNPGFFSSLLFGLVFSVGWTPCVGAFLGSALMLASQQGQALAGVLMLLAYSLGLSIPFIVSAVLIDRLKTAFDFIKRNYKVINIASGSLLVLVGVLMMTGLLGKLLTALS